MLKSDILNSRSCSRSRPSGTAPCCPLYPGACALELFTAGQPLPPYSTICEQSY